LSTDLDFTEEDFDSLDDEKKHLVEEFLAVQASLLQAVKRRGTELYDPLPHQEPFHHSQSVNRWMIGANRMGKTKACAQEVRWFALRDHPYRSIEGTGPIWCCAPTDEKLKDDVIPAVRSAVGESNIKNFVASPRPTLILRNGETIHFKNYMQPPITFASSAVRLLHFDEEPPWDIMEECYVRRSSYSEMNIVGGVTPVFGLTWLYDKVIQAHVNVGGWKESEWFGGKMADNKYISEEEKKRVSEGLTGVMHRIRVLGEILPIGGSLVFDPEVLAYWIKKSKEPLLRLERTNGVWREDEQGPLAIYDMPNQSCEYILGCDPAEGLNTGHSDQDPEHDETVIKVLNRSKRIMSATYRSGMVPPDYVGEEILPAMSDLFRRGGAIIERNNHGHTVIALAKKKMMGRLYSSPVDREARGERLSEDYGYLQAKDTRAFLVDLLGKYIRTKSYLEPDPPSIRQLMTFVKKANGRTEHQTGCKDDAVIASGLCAVWDRELPPAMPYRPRTEADELRELALKPSKPDTARWFRTL
jgi:phage terminase large subunit-like protein